eukprot:6706417-Prymnesium_polylepis.1
MASSVFSSVGAARVVRPASAPHMAVSYLAASQCSNSRSRQHVALSSSFSRSVQYEPLRASRSAQRSHVEYVPPLARSLKTLPPMRPPAQRPLGIDYFM